MSKNDNPQAIRLYESIAKHAGEDAARTLADNAPLSKSADYIKKFRWAENICESLEQSFDGETVKRIRMDCACGPGEGQIKKLKAIYNTASGLEDFAAKATAKSEDYKILYEDGALMLVYPTCYCSCVKRVDKPLTETWCLCTLGYAKRMFQQVLGREVNVELQTSVKTGGSQCRMKICFN
jgi:hypothetical protein